VTFNLNHTGLPYYVFTHFSFDLRESQDRVQRGLGAAVPSCLSRGEANASMSEMENSQKFKDSRKAVCNLYTIADLYPE